MGLFDDYGPDNPLVMVAAGYCKTLDLDALEPLVDAADFTVAGSITLEERSGNSGTCEYMDDPLYTLNSWGMPNAGSESGFEQHMAYPDARFREIRRKVIVSLAEFSPVGYYELFKKLCKWGVGVELNFGCPNIREGGNQKPILTFDPPRMEGVLDLIEVAKRELGIRIPTGVKLSVISDPGLLKEVGSVIAESGTADYVATTNTFANGLGYRKDHKSALRTDQAGPYGGIGGEALKPISLANAAAFRQALPDHIDVIRVGGISSGEDLWQSYHIGCRGVQIMSAASKYGNGVFTRVKQEYADIVG